VSRAAISQSVPEAFGSKSLTMVRSRLPVRSGIGSHGAPDATATAVETITSNPSRCQRILG
jgi:hypothetical protein